MSVAMVPPGLDVSAIDFPDIVKGFKRQASPAETCSTAAPSPEDLADVEAHLEAPDEWCGLESSALADAPRQEPDSDGDSDDEGAVRRLTLSVRRWVMRYATLLPKEPLQDSDSEDEASVRRLSLTVRRLVALGAKLCPAAK